MQGEVLHRSLCARSMNECVSVSVSVCVCVCVCVCVLGGNEKALWLLIGQNLTPKVEEKSK